MFLSMSFRVSMSLVSHVFIVPRFDVSRFAWFSVVVFMVVGMCSYGEVRVDSDRSFSLTWSFRCSVFCTSVCLWSFLMERQLSRAAHPPCKTQKKIASDAACAGRSNVAGSASGRISQRMRNKPVEKMCSQSASLKQMRTQMPRMLLVPRGDVARKCLLICSLQEQANKTTRDHN